MGGEPREVKSTRVWKASARSVDELFLGVGSGGELVSLNSLSSLIPAGAYTTFRTFEGNKVIRLREHICRLKRSAEMSGLYLEVNEYRLREILRRLVTECGEMDHRIRITLAFEESPGDIFIAVQELQAIPEQVYRDGVSVVTCVLQREQPKAKRTRFIERAESIRNRLQEEVEEAIMLGPDEELLEGLSSNFFAVHGDQVRTAEEGILPGVTRNMVLDCTKQCGITVRFQPVKLGEIESLEEAFITSSSRGIMPVVNIDGTPVGDGAPGPVTRRLMDCYDELLCSELEEI